MALELTNAGSDPNTEDEGSLAASPQGAFPAEHNPTLQRALADWPKVQW